MLKLVVTLSFRFNVISNLNTNELENAYYEAAHGIHHGRLTRPGHVFGVLRSVYVADEKFERDFSFAAFPTAGRDKKLVRYILYKIEEHLGNAGTAMLMAVRWSTSCRNPSPGVARRIPRAGSVCGPTGQPDTAGETTEPGVRAYLAQREARDLCGKFVRNDKTDTVR